MAELSAETTAIVERLRAEGDLVRNSGTNSIRSVKIKLDRFDGLFTTISTNVAEQTQILRQQAGIQEAAAEATRRQEDFANLQAEQEIVEKKNDRAAQEERDAKLIDGMRNAFSLKNLALGAGGAFLGYNLLKGAIDEQFNGAFSNMEKGISEFNPAVIQESFESFKGAVSNMEATINELNETVIGLKDDVDAFKNSLAVSLVQLLLAIPMGYALTKGLAKGLPAAVREFRRPRTSGGIEDGRGSMYDQYGRDMDRRAAAAEAERVRLAEAEKARLAEAERVKAIENARRIETERFKRAGMVRPVTPSFTPEGPGYLPDRMSVAGMQTASNINKPVLPTIDKPMTGFNNSPQFLKPQGATVFKPNVVNTAPANLNKKATKSDLQKLLQEYNDRIPAKWRNALIKIFDYLNKANVAFKVVDLIFILQALEQTDEAGRTKLLGTWLGGFIGAGAGGVAGGAAGLLGGPLAWITVPAGGIAGALLGGLAGDWIGEQIVLWALGEEPPQSEIDKVNGQINDALGTSQLMEEAAAQYASQGGTTTTANYAPPSSSSSSSNLFGVPAAAIAGMGVGSGTLYPNARLSSAQARRIVNIAPGFETNALDAIAALALQNGNTVIIKGGDQTIAPVLTSKGPDIMVEAPTVIGNHIDKNTNTYASGPYPGVVYG